APVNVQVSMFSGPMMAAPQQPMQVPAQNADQQVLVTPQPAPAPAVPPVAGNYTDVTARSVETAQTVPQTVPQTDPSFSQVPVTAAEPTVPAPSPAQNVIRFCQECGASLPENAVFCSNCGHRL
ncbi:MAG: zinc ribbon domain-containing protein, partial [Clostridia bacterium]|nr:zinc ribbon domain-containing protein [Clostridia bacterium]